MMEAAARSVILGRWTFDYDDAGPKDAPVVLLLHGFPQDRTCWRPISAQLNEAGYRTVALDQRGYSPGARPAGADAYRMSRLVADAIGLLDALDIRHAHVIGHDWGGAVAWALASGHPDRLLSLTVLSTPHPGALRRSFLRSTQGLHSWYMGMFQVPGLTERLLTPGGRPWRELMRGLPESQVAHYSDRVREPGALTAMLAWYRAMPMDMARPSVPLHRITVPTLYVWGQRDPALGEYAARHTADFVKGPYTFVVLPTQGHWLPERASDEVGRAVLAHLGSTTED